MFWLMQESLFIMNEYEPKGMTENIVLVTRQHTAFHWGVESFQ